MSSRSASLCGKFQDSQCYIMQHCLQEEEEEEKGLDKEEEEEELA